LRLTTTTVTRTLLGLLVAAAVLAAPGAAGAAVAVTVTVPTAPHAVGAGTSFTVSGTLQPRHTAGSTPVAIFCLHSEAGAWVLRQTVPATVSDRAAGGSTYTATVSLPSSGVWRLQAYHAGDGDGEVTSEQTTDIAIGAKPDLPVWDRDGVTTIPEQMAYRGNSRQLIVATGAAIGAHYGTLQIFDYRDGDWVQTMAVAARFGRRGLIDGLLRHAGSLTTPTGIWTIPSWVFGTHLTAPVVTKMGYRHITNRSWWSSEKTSAYNRWVETSRHVYGEHLADNPVEYEIALSTGYNATPNKRVYGRGAGIFLHVHGKSLTAGCISITRAGMLAVLRRLDPAKAPVFAIGTTQTGMSTDIFQY
jgi:L,D-peptidoglycan transpeptidase YkuD (ErfK/YbiS/YcfS/YnhG family)